VAPKDEVTSKVERIAAISIGGNISVRARPMTFERALKLFWSCGLSASFCSKELVAKQNSFTVRARGWILIGSHN